MKFRSWRVINTGPLPGAHNMAIDESLLCLFNPNTSDPILRIYGWNPPSLSLGRFQKAEDVLDLKRCHADSLPVVRRISGGGVIYHADEITYSIVCSPEQIPLAASVKDSFRILTGFLIEFYQTLGLNASYAVDCASETERLGTRTAFCFAGKESFDILINGKKIGGNAQRRLRNVIFQHGSIPVANRALTGLGYMDDCSPIYAQTITSLMECGVTDDLSVLTHALIEGFKSCMGGRIHTSQLSYDEQQRYQQLLTVKYTTDQWNLRGEAT